MVEQFNDAFVCKATLGTRGFFSRVVRTWTRAAKPREKVFRAVHNYRDMTDTGNRARKTSGTQGIARPESERKLVI